MEGEQKLTKDAKIGFLLAGLTGGMGSLESGCENVQGGDLSGDGAAVVLDGGGSRAGSGREGGAGCGAR